MLIWKYLHMKFSLWSDHGALNSREVFNAFASGAKSLGHDVVWNDPVSDVDVIWSVLWFGRMAKNKSIWERNLAQSKPTIVLEVGGIKRNNTWKVGLNGINRDAYFGPSNNNNNRANFLRLKTKPWRQDGEFILICGQHERSEQWRNQPRMSKWVMNTIEAIQKHSNRPILFRPHPRCRVQEIEHEYRNVYRQDPIKISASRSDDNYDLGFDNIWATVSLNSNPGVHSILEGVPAFVGSSSLAYDAANDIDFLHNIETPLMPDRQQWLNDYAWTEFSIKEISLGIPLKRLTNKLF
jgi:hypothetical protein